MSKPSAIGELIPRGKFSIPLIDRHTFLPRNLVGLKIDPKKSVPRFLFIEGQAGQGKTTLVAQLLQNRTTGFLWYRMEEADGSAGYFLTALLTGLEQALPGFASPSVLAAITEGDLHPEHYRALLDQIILDLKNSPLPEFTIVFDDVHRCDNSPLTLSLIKHLLCNVSRQIRFILASRHNLTDLFDPVLLQGSVVSLGNGDLALSGMEIAELFNRLFQIPLTRKAVQSLMKATSGWIMGLVFAGKILGRDLEPLQVETRLASLENLSNNIFPYFLQQVLDQLPEPTRKVLVTLSLLEEIPIDLAREMTGEKDIQVILLELEQNNNFLLPINPELSGYVLHHLMQEGLRFLAKQEIPPHELKNLYGIAGRWHHERQNLREAAHYFLRGGNFKSAQSVLREAALAMNLQTHMATLQQKIDALPEDVVALYPWLAYSQALALIHTDPPKALPWLEKALERFFSEKDEIGELLCCIQIIFFRVAVDGLYLRGYSLLNRAMELYDRTSCRLAPSLKGHAENIFLLANTFFFLDLPQADRFLNSGLEYARRENLANLEAEARVSRLYRFLLGGNVDDCSRELENAWGLLNEQFIGELNRGAISLARLNYLQVSGEFTFYQRHKHAFCQAIGQEILEGSVFQDYLLLWDLDMYFARGDWPRFVETMHTALASKGAGGGPHLRSLYLLYQLQFLAENGEMGLLPETLQEVKRLREMVGGRLFEIMNHVGFGAVYARLGETESALSHFNLAMECHSPYMRASALAHRSALLLELGDRSGAHRDLRELLATMRRGGYRHFYFWTPGLMPGLLSEAVQMRIEPEFARWLAAERLDSAILDEGTLIPLLRIRTLGDLRLESNGKAPIRSNDLSELQRQLLGSLISNPDLAMSQDQLQAQLWPDSPEKRARSNFDTLLSRLRKNLKELLGNIDPRHYLSLKNGILSLSNVRVDIQQFRDSLRKGFTAKRKKDLLKAENHLHQGLDLWRGEFLPTVKATEEIDQQRRNFHLAGLEGALSLADTLEALHLHDQAIPVLEGAWTREPTQEKIVQQLYSLLIRQGLPTRAQAVVNRYVEALQKEGFIDQEVKNFIDRFWSDN